MCGRYTQTREGKTLRARFACGESGVEILPRYNQAPGQPAAVVLPGARGACLTLMRWGVAVAWRGQPMINARAETAVSRPAFRAAMARRRCLVPADGFYEWQRDGDGAKTPWRFVLRSGDLFAFAGVWSPAGEGERAGERGFAILTMAANACVAPVHDRMPVLLSPAAEAAWMDASLGAAQALDAALRAHAGDALRAYTVSPRVNKVAQDDPSLVEPAGPPPRQGRLFE